MRKQTGLKLGVGNLTAEIVDISQREIKKYLVFLDLLCNLLELFNDIFFIVLSIHKNIYKVFHRMSNNFMLNGQI